LTPSLLEQRILKQPKAISRQSLELSRKQSWYYGFLLSLGVSTVETNRDRDFSICRDQLRLRFLDLSRSTFETCRDYPYCWDKISIETSQLLRQAFWNCRDCLDRLFLLFSSVEIESLDRGHVETNRDPPGLLLVPRPLIFDFTFCWFGHILFLNDIFLTFWQDVKLLPNSIF
jgi:hypothetical protein